MQRNESPKISVIIHTYNHERYVKECIESILNQTLPPFEILICDDHSTDDTWSIIHQYEQKFSKAIKAYRHSKNMGMHYNANFGLKTAKGDLVTSLGGDDRWLPKKLELEWKALQKYPEARIAYSNVYTIDAHGRRTGIWYNGKGTTPPSGDVFVKVFSKNFFPYNRSVFRNQLMCRTAINEVEHYDRYNPLYVDWDFKIRLTAKFNVVYSGEALVEYRIHGLGVHNSPPEIHFKSMLYTYEKNAPLLANRSIEEATIIRCHVESLLAQQQSYLSQKKLCDPEYTTQCVYERNRILFETLPKPISAKLRKQILALFTILELRASRELFKSGNRKLALRYLLKSLYRPEILFRYIRRLPVLALSRLKLMYRTFIYN